MRFIILLSALVITAASCNGPVKKEVKDTTPTVAALPEEKKDTASFTTMQWIDSVKIRLKNLLRLVPKEKLRALLTATEKAVSSTKQLLLWPIQKVRRAMNWHLP
jgi:hypothetical protein